MTTHRRCTSIQGFGALVHSSGTGGAAGFLHQRGILLSGGVDLRHRGADLLDAADLLVAHNAAFDRQWFGRGHLPATDKRWLCSMEDMRWPADRQLRSRPSVRDLALAYEIPVWAAHRALTDCIYLAEVFRRCDDLEHLIECGLEPRQLMRAQVSYDDRHLARDAGFRWNEPVKGAWARRLSASEAGKLDFPVVPVDPELPLAS